MSNTDAYRTNSRPQFRGATPMLRFKATARSMFRRAVGPGVMLAMIGAASILCSGCIYGCADVKANDASAKADYHFRDWESSINRKQSEADRRMADVEKKEREVDARLKMIETIMSMSPGLYKDPDKLLNLVKHEEKK